eukprot:6972055-Pyramimonas_sp.AAC.1
MVTRGQEVSQSGLSRPRLSHGRTTPEPRLNHGCLTCDHCAGYSRPGGNSIGPFPAAPEPWLNHA